MRRFPVLSILSGISAFQSNRICSFRMISARASHSNTLFVATTADTASLNIAEALKDSCEWNTRLSLKSSFVFSAKAAKLSSSTLDEDRQLWLWIQDQPLLHMNNVDGLLNSELSSSEASQSHSEIKFDEVIFLSKHSAASGKASLTVHPIDPGESGGFPGRCSPPNKRIAELYRAVLAETKLRGMQDQFEVTLEATHHGPHSDLPACFVEIGSTEAEWGIPEAGLVWAHCLSKHFGIPPKGTGSETGTGGQCADTASSIADRISDTSSCSSSSVPSKNSSPACGGVVLVTIGGGHYVPKMNDAARFGARMYTGHSLATYTLQRHLDGSERAPVQGGWQHIIREALSSTRMAHPDAKLVVLLDKKAFTAEYKHSITSYLDEMQVTWTHKVSDVKTIWERTVMSEVVGSVSV